MYRTVFWTPWERARVGSFVKIVLGFFQKKDGYPDSAITNLWSVLFALDLLPSTFIWEQVADIIAFLS